MNVTTLRIFQQLHGATFVYGPVEGMLLIGKPPAAKIDAVRPVIEMDYAEQGKSNQPHDNVKALVAIDRSSGAIFASGVMQKGDDGGYVTQSLSVWIASLGYTMVTLHSDKEPAICWVRDRVQANLTERGMSVTTRASPTHSHESNGGAERAVQSVRGLARTLVAQVEDRTGLIFGADSPLWLWAFRHAGWILTRFGRRRDTGMTPYAKLFCKQYRQPLLMYADAVIARRPGAQINKLEHQWREGLWVGRDGSTNEHLIASGGGIVRCRAVKRY